jgi:hypothetical protein
LVFRHIIAAVHFNINLHRDNRKNEDGSEQMKVVYPKFKNGEATVRNVKVKPNYGMNYLISELLYQVTEKLKDDFIFIRLC